MFMRVISWPLGYVIVARGDQKLFFWTELLSNASYAALAWAGVQVYGLEGAGMAFFVLYVCYLVALNIILRKLTGFRWSAANVRLGCLLTPAVGLVFAGRLVLREVPAMILGAVVTLAVGTYSLKTLCVDSASKTSPNGPKTAGVFAHGAFGYECFRICKVTEFTQL